MPLLFLMGCQTLASQKDASKRNQSAEEDLALPAGISETNLPTFYRPLPSDAELYQLPSGDRFFGILDQKNRPNSNGIYYPYKQQHYVIHAQFKNGKPMGDARVISPINVYTGPLDPNNRLPHGYGITVTNDSRYEGYYNAGELSGKGKMILDNGDYAIGDYQGGDFRGTFYFQNGDQLKGVLSQGQLSGTLIRKDGTRETIETMDFINQ